jgi:hypothetical protein
MKLDTSIDPDDLKHYHVVATTRNPRIDDDQEAVKERVNQTRLRAIQFAQQWASDGYWASVYNQLNGECVIDYAPNGEAA